MMGRTAKKLRGRGGFSLTELLVTTALLALLTSMATLGINTALKCRRDAIQLADAQTLGSTALTVISNELRYGRSVKIPGDDGKPATLDSATYGGGVAIELDGNGRLKIGGWEVLSPSTYKDGALNRHGGTLSLASHGTDPIFRNGTTTGTVTVTLDVTEGTHVLWTGTVTVAPLNGFTAPDPTPPGP